jgi:ABC-type multidrug transport system ATPase subunit
MGSQVVDCDFAMLHQLGGERRLLLNDILGFVAPGKLTALMGESGAGKVPTF